MNRESVRKCASFDVQEWVKQIEEGAGKNYHRYAKLLELTLQSGEAQVGQTPKEVIWSLNKTKLYRFTPVKEKLFPVPVLMIYALINRPYVLDLHPGNSMVEYLVNRGFDVYMLDWGYPGPEDKDMKFDDYVLDQIPRAVQLALRTSGAKELSILGYCMGGTIATLYAATHPQAPIHDLILLASPIDFADAGAYTTWLNGKYFHVDKMVDTMGNIPPDMIDFGNKMLKPVTNFVSSWVNLYDRVWDEKFVFGWQKMNKWINDGIAFPGEAFRQWIKELYQNNKLIKGEFKMRGRAAKLENIKCRVLNFAGERDHIVPIQQSRTLLQFISSKDYEFISLPAGHVSLVTGRLASKQVYPKIAGWLQAGQEIGE